MTYWPNLGELIRVTVFGSIRTNVLLAPKTYATRFCQHYAAYYWPFTGEFSSLNFLSLQYGAVLQ
jgi:hypothetical protein